MFTALLSRPRKAFHFVRVGDKMGASRQNGVLIPIGPHGNRDSYDLNGRVTCVGVRTTRLTSLHQTDLDLIVLAEFDSRRLCASGGWVEHPDEPCGGKRIRHRGNGCTNELGRQRALRDGTGSSLPVEGRPGKLSPFDEEVGNAARGCRNVGGVLDSLV